jgi:hypothetical protein
LAELVDVDGNFREYEFNVLQSLEEAARNYGVSNNQLAVFGEWLIGTVERRKPSAVGATLLMLDYLGIQSDGLSRIAGSLKSDSDIGLAVLQLSQELKNAEKIVVSTLSNFY